MVSGKRPSSEEYMFRVFCQTGLTTNMGQWEKKCWFTSKSEEAVAVYAHLYQRYTEQGYIQTQKMSIPVGSRKFQRVSVAVDHTGSIFYVNQDDVFVVPKL